MVFSYYLTKIPYCLTWYTLKLFRIKKMGYFYCGDELDLEIFKSVQRHLQPLPVIAKNKQIQSDLEGLGIKSTLLPKFPDFVIMTRHAAHKFPCNKITRIGMRHGPYHFKKFTNASNYNMFDVFFMTSSEDVRHGAKIGIKSAIGMGYPKLDCAFDGTYNTETISDFKTKNRIISHKKTLLFSATWEGSGMSAVDKWAKQLGKLTEKYNVLVTLHPWVSKEYKDIISSTKGVTLIKDKNLAPWIMSSDICIGDTSSVLAEFSALGKPVITFRVEQANRLTNEIIELLDSFTYRVDTFEELRAKLRDLRNEDPLKRARTQANAVMFNHLDGTAGLRIASAIVKLIPELKLPEIDYFLENVD